MYITKQPSHDFVAVDVEYADNEQDICQIGLAVVRNLEITARRSWLIQPPDNHYEERVMRVHHITPEDTAAAPTFPEVWPEIQPYLLMGELWAHNAASVEQPVLEKNLHLYGFNASFLSINDSRELYHRNDCPANTGNGLAQCCMALGIPCENHHDAEADAVMCAKIVIAAARGQQPDWTDVPVSNEEMRKMQQEKRILRLGNFCDYYASASSGDEDVIAEMTSTCQGAVPQTIDVFDKGDIIKESGAVSVDFSRIDVRPDNPLRGKKVVVTGLFRLERKDIEKAVDAMGAKRVSKPTRNTDAVIMGTRNVGPNKLVAIEEQEAKGHHLARIVGSDDLEALLYGDGDKFFEGTNDK